MDKKNKKERGAFSHLFEWAAPHKGGYIASLSFATVGVACGIAPYFCVAQIVLALLRGELSIGFYGFYCLLAAGFWALRYLFHGISTSLSHKSTFAVISEVRLKLTKKLTRLPMGYLLDTPSGRLKNILVERVDSIEPTLAHVVPEMGGNVLISIATMAYLFALDWRMALAALIPLPLGLLCYMGMKNGYEERFANYVAKNKRLNDTAVEYIGGIEVIKAFNQSASSYEKFTTAAREAAASAIDWMRSTLPFFSLAMSVFPAVLVSVLPIGAMLYRGGSLPLENFVVSIILSLGVMGPLITTMSYTDDIAKVNTIVDEINEVLTQPDLARPTAQATVKDYGIRLSDVRFAYREKLVLHGINLSIPAGSVTALVGPSGGGKSTIAKLIASLWDATDGSITIGGTDIRQIPLTQLNNMIAYVAQDNYLFDESIRENIRMGRPSASDAEVEEAARQSGCHNFITQLENGYETCAGSAGGHLSGGERQRITIARAMLKNAPIVILDEATAYTDPENEAVIQAAVSKLVAGKTLIVIAHRLSTIIDSDSIVVIEGGRVAAQGTHCELLLSSPLYKNMWDAHTSVKDSIETTTQEVLA
ncbi:ABC transporter ATP-binding protein [Faecalicatena contorta]|uniref:ATP-binding cassette, subfamily B n=1 Tax=Faecalicatena contorta TaxID=39482 RepID=A0A316A364_9FIRM|nr:ABC transporter ATP-binding protein [Faecalicatena contorta]PWJ52311.1 ATP-binding cassette subfamily B protein [Faecalicatena contorta]SUQ12589.1 ATP-binding cassette, subfamily B [Faecalicatena contorta]